MSDSKTHSHAPDRSTSKRALRIALALTASFMAAEVVGGLISGSLALLADAAHMLSDAGSLGIALVAIWLAEKPATLRRSFGYQRAEILAALANGMTLVVVSLWIFYEAFQRLQDPPDVIGGTVLVIAVIGLIVNLAAAWVLSRGEQESLNVAAALRHVLADLAGSVGVIVAAVVILTTGWEYADPIIGALIGALVLASAWPVLRDSGRILLEQAPSDLDTAAIETALTDTDGVEDVHDLHIWTITSGFPALAVHVLVDPDRNCHERRRHLERMLEDRFEISHTTIQVDHIEPQLLQIEGVDDRADEQPDDTPAAFVFADIAGYTALTEVHGDRRAADVVDDFADHARAILRDREGDLVKVIGDALMLRMPDAADAILLAHELTHGEMANAGHPAVGVGIDFGTAERRDSDWYGAAVNTASRIAALAGDGEIVISSRTREAAGVVASIGYEPLGERSLRNVRGPVELFRVLCDEERPDLIIDPVCRMSLDAGEVSSSYRHEGVEYRFCSDSCRDAFREDPAAVLAARERG